MNRDELADAARCSRSGIGRGFDGADIAADHDGDIPGANVFLADERDVRRLDHRVCGLDRSNQATSLHQPQCVAASVCHFARNSNRLRHMQQLHYTPTFSMIERRRRDFFVVAVVAVLSLWPASCRRAAAPAPPVATPTVTMTRDKAALGSPVD